MEQEDARPRLQAASASMREAAGVWREASGPAAELEGYRAACLTEMEAARDLCGLLLERVKAANEQYALMVGKTDEIKSRGDQAIDHLGTANMSLDIGATAIEGYRAIFQILGETADVELALINNRLTLATEKMAEAVNTSGEAATEAANCSLALDNEGMAIIGADEIETLQATLREDCGMLKGLAAQVNIGPRINTAAQAATDCSEAIDNVLPE